jgi:diguanylate cyclase (GGDEF)-like protein
LVRRSPTLRAISASTVVILVGMIAMIGGLGFAATQYQGSMFSSTLSSVQETSEVLGELDRSLTESLGPMIEVLYRPSGGEQLDQSVEAYRESSAAISAAFDRAEEDLAGRGSASELAAVRETWESVDAVVRASPEEWSNEELLEAFSRGFDPWLEQVLIPLDTMDVQRLDTRQATIEEMSARSEQVSDAQRLIGPLLAAMVAAALVVSLLAIRRVSLRVVQPLAEVGDAARKMHDDVSFEPVRVQGAVTEVQDLAATLNEAAASVHRHHRILRDQALTDTMTSLPNRDAFAETLRSLLEGPYESSVAVLFIDLDDFKDVNDSLGHAAGDELLRVVASRLLSVTRGAETVARLGGDEFAVALTVAADSNGPTAVADRICRALEEPLQVDGDSVAMGCSIGIATSRSSGGPVDVDTLLGKADFAMYMAKSQGKGRFEVYSEGVHAELTSRTHLARDIGEALRRNEFVLEYQPLVVLNTRRLVGFEALIRWEHPSRGLVPPGLFVPLAEDSGAITEIGAWVLEEACSALAEYQRYDEHLVMNVNVSPRQLADPGFPAQVMTTLQRHDIAPRELTLEVTEAMAMTSTEDAARALAQLRRQGVHVALDDFGTGFSSLQYLGDLPADTIKIDRSFVDSSRAHNHTTLEAIVTLAQKLGMQVIAEGIEREEDVERLTRLGSLMGQGYLFARPMSVGDAREFVRAGASNRN